MWISDGGGGHLTFFGVFYLWSFWIFCVCNFWFLTDFVGFLEFCWKFFWTYWILFKLLRLLLKVTKVTTGHHKWPKIGLNSKISSFLPSAGARIGVDPRSGLYLLVIMTDSTK